MDGLKSEHTLQGPLLVLLLQEELQHQSYKVMAALQISLLPPTDLLCIVCDPERLVLGPQLLLDSTNKLLDVADRTSKHPFSRLAVAVDCF